MSWQLESLAAIGLALALGFAWYERSAPPAKVLALVAALAALATVGRIAFAALPNVKPVTDIVLFSGYALGGAPGFAVGAFAALVSNFFFGQGPWTPWQMLAWGGVGVGGAALARVFGRDLGRIPLAVACALAGALFGAVMDGFQWSQGARQDLPHYLAVSATSLPFNVAHVFGNILFCLLLGPSFVRALRRYRRRFEVRWALPVAGAVLALASLAGPSRAEASAAGRAADYLRSAQNDNGGFGAVRGGSSSQLYSGWASLGLAAAGINPTQVRRGSASVIDYVREHAGELTETGDIERTILVLRAAGLSPRAFAGRDLVAELLGRRSARGSFGSSINLTAFGVLALRAAGTPASAAWLAREQNSDGGFSFAPHALSDVDDTGAVLEALAAAGLRSDRSVKRAVGYLRAAQNSDGGFGQQPQYPSNAQSTAWAVQGLVAAGSVVSRRGRSPLAYLSSLQAGDGSIRYSRSSAQTPVWVTAQALDALELRAFPLTGSVRRTRKRQRAPVVHHRRHAKRRARRASKAAIRAAPSPVLAPATAQAPAPVPAVRRSSAAVHPSAGVPALELIVLAVAAAFVLRRFRRSRRRPGGGSSPG